MQDRLTIRKIITDTLTSAFSHVRIRDIKFHEDMETDGTEVLAINVIFQGDLDPKKLPKVVAELRHKLSEVPELELATPVLSFISQSDIEQQKRASG